MTSISLQDNLIAKSNSMGGMWRTIVKHSCCNECEVGQVLVLKISLKIGKKKADETTSRVTKLRGCDQ